MEGMRIESQVVLWSGCMGRSQPYQLEILLKDKKAFCF